MAASQALAHAQTPLPGHYPPGQSGIRGAASPAPGWGITNFSRFFTNLEVKDAQGAAVESVQEMRYANITMVTWVTGARVLGMNYGTMIGIPFATGNLNPSSEEVESSSFGLGDILVTPSLYARGSSFDYQFQFTVWTASGRYSPGAPDNRGTGFWALLYSLGGSWYPGADRADWSLSAIARYEQNFEQAESGIHPGDDLVVDWGVGKGFRVGERPLELGASGFATWQLTEQSGSPPGTDTSLYRYFGAGPEGNYSPWERWTFRVRAHWEFEGRNTVQGNNLWIILHYAL